MSIDEIIELALNGKYDAMMDELEKLHPRKILEFFRKMVKATEGMKFHGDAEDFYEDFQIIFTPEQWARWKYLNSSDYERDYLMSIPEEEMTDQDWFGLRATDF